MRKNLFALVVLLIVDYMCMAAGFACLWALYWLALKVSAFALLLIPLVCVLTPYKGARLGIAAAEKIAPSPDDLRYRLTALLLSLLSVISIIIWTNSWYDLWDFLEMNDWPLAVLGFAICTILWDWRLHPPARTTQNSQVQDASTIDAPPATPPPENE